MLDSADQQAFWEAFKKSPLFADWRGAEAGLSTQFRKIVKQSGEAIFVTGQPADALYLVGSGVVRETLKHNGNVWMQREYRPGEYFGQHALFHQTHISEAVAESPAVTVVYAIPAGVLRSAMERNPAFFEILLHETRAGRLRSIPLFRELSDAELTQLALVIQQIEYKANQEIPLDRQPGLYVIDYGQIEVTGPAVLDPKGWRLTAGNFFFTPGVTHGARCAANSARAHLDSRLLYLPAEYSERLIPAFPDVGRLVAAPLDIARELAAVPLFERLSPDRRSHLAQFVGWGFIPEQQNITTQGGVGHSFVIIREGAAITTSVDEQGRPRLQSRFDAGDSYGETSLLQGKPRDASVRAIASGCKRRSSSTPWPSRAPPPSWCRCSSAGGSTPISSVSRSARRWPTCTISRPWARWHVWRTTTPASSDSGRPEIAFGKDRTDLPRRCGIAAGDRSPSGFLASGGAGAGDGRIILSTS